MDGDDWTGRRIGDFLLLRRIGKGGMGTVYEAEQESMRRRVALKILDGGLALSGHEIARFEREAWVAGRLSHPNIVKVFGKGTAGDGAIRYIVMEQIAGRSLREEIQRMVEARGGRVVSASSASSEHVRDMASLFVDVADALDYVHRQGIAHRDIKPGNLLLCDTERRLVLTDFGLARDENVSQITRRGDFLGTVHYMSPEQLLAQRVTVDHRTDIWSFGVSLYEAVTLRLPFDGDSQEAYLSAVVMREPTRARIRNRAVPRDLETVLMKCLQRDPAHRYSSAADLRDDLKRFLEGRPVQAKRPGPVTRALRFLKRNRAAAAAVAVVVLAALALALAMNQQRPDDAKRAAYEKTLVELGEMGSQDALMELTGAQQQLRDAFLAGQLPDDLAKRFARTILHPDIPLSSYISRSEPQRIGIDFHVVYPWNLYPVVESQVVLDGRPVARWKESDVPSNMRARFALSDSQVAALPLGRHEVSVVAGAYFIDKQKIDAFCGGHATPWNPAGGFTADSVKYGSRLLPWNQFWPGLRDGVPHIFVRELRYPPKVFQLVEDLPSGYPAAIQSEELGDSLRAAVKFGEFSLREWDRKKVLLYRLRRVGVCPAPVACRLRFETSMADVILTTRMIIPLGDGSRDLNTATHTAISIDESEAFGGDSVRFRAWWAGLRNGQPLRLRAIMEGSRVIAARSPGFDSYWDGKLAFEDTTNVWIER